MNRYIVENGNIQILQDKEVVKMDKIDKWIKLEEQLSKKIVNLISPMINGLNYSQIEGLLRNIREKILHLTSFRQNS